MKKDQSGNIHELSEYGINRTLLHERPGAWIVKCACGYEDRYGFPSYMNASALLSKVRQRGWDLGRKATPVCFECRNKDRKPMTTNKTLSIGPDPKIARRIYALLDDHFDEETRIYRGDWTDTMIALRAETSVEMVTRIRRDAYGELAEDPRLQRVNDDLELLRMELNELRAQFEAKTSELLGKIKVADDLVASMRMLKAG